MAINPLDPNARIRLQRALAYHQSHAEPMRRRRQNLYELFKGRPSIDPILLPGTGDETLVNLIQAYILGQSVALAWRGPKWSIKSRTPAGAGFDARIQAFLNSYTEILEAPRIYRQVAIDSGFGWGAVKIINSLAPKGVTSPYAPRMYRVAPDNLIVDGTAPSFDEAAFIADTYLVPLDEAIAAFPQFANRLKPWPGSATMSMGADQFQNTDAYAQEYTRLIDVYLPTTGVIATWPSQTDRFGEVTEMPIGLNETPINPYEILSMLNSPDVLEEMARLDSLKNLHLLANDMLFKGAQQARHSKRNPVGQLGSDHDLSTLLNKKDGEGAFVDDLNKIGLWTLPGPDPSINQMAMLAMGLFSQYGGNLEVALGQSAGAGTARQTQSLIQQINARQSVDREAYERFVANTGKKLATLAFQNEYLTIASQITVPGTTYQYTAGWAPPQYLPRPAAINDFAFEVVPYSTTFRSPQDRLAQLMQASGQVLQFMQVLAAGAPINMQAVLTDMSEAYDLVPSLINWWTGETPDPVSKATNGSQYVAQPGPNGSEVKHTYDSNAQSGGEQYTANVQGNTPGGISIPQVGGVA